MKVLLIYPCSDMNNPNIELDSYRLGELPLGLMSIATMLDKCERNVQVIDCRLYTKQETMEKIKSFPHTDIVALSVMTVQIKHALEISKFIKEHNPNMPIIWGGIHPTLFPEQTIQSPYIDYVIVGDGEYTVIEITDWVDYNSSILKNIEGLVFKYENNIIANRPTEPVNVSELPDINYELLDIERYINKILFTGKKVKTLSVHTSRGCPYRCKFCVNSILNFRNWRPIPIPRVINTITSLTKKYNLNHILFIDDYLFGNISRTKEIINNLPKNILWEANIRASDFRENKVNDEMLSLMQKSGCYSLRIGAESGSPRILKLLQKDISISDTVKAIKQCKKYNIIPLLYFITAIPTETLEEAQSTFNLIISLYKINPNIRVIVPGLFRPYPGSELFNICKSHGFVEPTSLEQWSDINFDGEDINLCTWIPDKNKKQISLMREYIRYYTISHEKLNPIFYIPIKILAYISELRFKHNFWKFPIEPLIINKLKKLKWR